MKCNRIRFDKLKAQWDILKATAAFVHADQQMIEQSERELQGIHWDEAAIDAMGWNKVAKTEIQKLEAQIKELELVAQGLLEEEKYELLQQTKEIWEILQKELTTLKSR